MKTIYLVRHGETEMNATKRFNTPTTPLSEKGRKQAEEIAKRCTKLPIETIIASTTTRTKETAAIVAERTRLEVETSPLFVEPIYAARFHGAKIMDPEVQEVVKLYGKNYSNPDFRFEDGENFADLKKRSLACLKYLEERPEENILVISHAFFTFIIVAAAIYGEDFSGEECEKVIAGFDLLENTALTILTFGAPTRKVVANPAARWQLKVWNDHAHLG